MEDSVILGIAVIILILVYAYGAIFHENFFPRATQADLKTMARHIASLQGKELDTSFRLPVLFIGSRRDIMELVPEEERWKYLEDDKEEFVFKHLNRIAIASWRNREPLLAHALAHWFEEGQDTGRNEDEAWKITRIYLQSLYPSRYYFVVLLYGWTGIWGYEFGKPIFEITAS